MSRLKKEILNKLKEYAGKMGKDHLGGDDIASPKRGGLRDFDGYDNVQYNKDMPMDEMKVVNKKTGKDITKHLLDYMEGKIDKKKFEKLTGLKKESVNEAKSEKDFKLGTPAVFDGDRGEVITNPKTQRAWTPNGWGTVKKGVRGIMVYGSNSFIVPDWSKTKKFNESVINEAKDMTLSDYIKILDNKIEDAQKAVTGKNGSKEEYSNRGDILQNFKLFRNYLSAMDKRHKGNKTKLRFISENINEAKLNHYRITGNSIKFYVKDKGKNLVLHFKDKRDFDKLKLDLDNPKDLQKILDKRPKKMSISMGESVNEAKVNYNFSADELKRVLKLLGRNASTEVKMIKAFEKAFGRKLTRDELFESINEVGVNVWYIYKKANKNKNKFFNMLSDFRKKHSDTAWIKMLNYALEDFNENPKKYKTIDDKQNILFKNLQNNKKVYEGMMSTIDQIRQDSKDVRDFVKNVFKDREFKKMSNDKDFIKYLKSIYEGVDESAKVKSLEEKINLFVEKNVPTNPSKWSYYKSQAKKKFDVYPSAYANGWAAKKYKAAGGGWKKEK